MKIYQVNYSEKLDKAAIIKLKQRQFRGILRTGMGYDNIDLKEAQRLGFEVKWLGDYCSSSVAEHNIRLALQMCERIGWQMEGKIALVIGSEGRIGKKLCRKLRDLGVKVLRHDVISYKKAEQAGYVTLTHLFKALGDAHFIFLCIPMTKTTKNYFGVEQFKQMHGQPIIINAAREGLLDLDWVENAISNSLIRGYCMDDIPEHRIKDNYRFIGTEHIAAKTDVAEENRMKQIAKKLKEFGKK